MKNVHKAHIAGFEREFRCDNAAMMEFEQAASASIFELHDMLFTQKKMPPYSWIVHFLYACRVHKDPVSIDVWGDALRREKIDEMFMLVATLMVDAFPSPEADDVKKKSETPSESE